MPTNNGVFNLINMIKNSPNPQELAYNTLSKQYGGNPFFANLLNLAKNGQGDQIETIARNMMKERGLDFDKEFNSFKQNLGL